MSSIGNRLPRKVTVTGRPGNRAESETHERARAQAETAALRIEAASQAKATGEELSSRDAILTDYGTRLDDLENPAP